MSFILDIDLSDVPVRSPVQQHEDIGPGTHHPRGISTGLCGPALRGGGGKLKERTNQKSPAAAGHRWAFPIGAGRAPLDGAIFNYVVMRSGNAAFAILRELFWSVGLFSPVPWLIAELESSFSVTIPKPRPLTWKAKGTILMISAQRRTVFSCRLPL